MNIDLAALPDDVGSLQQLVRSLVAERTSLREANAEIERLHLIIKQLQRHQFGRRAERLDNDQLHLGFEDLEVDLARVEAKLRSAKAKPDKPDGERPSLPAHLERENVRLDVEDQACTCCGGALHLIGETVAARRPCGQNRVTGNGPPTPDRHGQNERVTALGRKNHLFAGSDGGGARWATVCSLIGTAKLNNVEPYAWLKDVLQRMTEGQPVSRLDEFLPWNWQPKSGKV
jgi:hypothetical protein